MRAKLGIETERNGERSRIRGEKKRWMRSFRGFKRREWNTLYSPARCCCERGFEREEKKSIKNTAQTNRPIIAI